MTWPTRPGEPPYPDDDEAYGDKPAARPQPTFTPHGQQAPADRPRPTFTPHEQPAPQEPPAPHQQPAHQQPAPGDFAPRFVDPYEATAPRSGPQPTFTPHERAAPADYPSAPGPQPTFTPHQQAATPPLNEPAPPPHPPPAPPPPARPQPAQPQPAQPQPARPQPAQPASKPQPTFTPHPPADYPAPMYPQALAYPDAPTTHLPRLTRLRDQTSEHSIAARGDTALLPGRAGTGTAAQASPSLARSSQVMALGTLVSRITGFLRTFIFVIALGTNQLADAYNNSNTLPNTVYYLMLGGIFTSVVVPLLVRSAKNDPDRGEAYAERIFTLGAVSLFAVTLVATLAAGPLVDLYASSISNQAEHHLMVVFAYFFIPQIFFYGMDSLLGAILNTRGKFGPNMWTPVINNVVVIAVGGLFIVTEGLHKTPETISPGGVKLLGIGTTLGIVIQSIALFPVLRRVGFSMRLVFDFRRDEAREIGRMAGWMTGYVVSQWAGYVVVQNVANAAAARSGGGSGTGYSAWSYAWSLFQLPYAVVGISVISALLPRMSGHATDRRYSLVREDFSIGVRLASVIVMPAAIFLAVLGPPLCEVLFSYGSSSVADARYIGEVFGVLSLGLIGYMLTQLQLRVFYSFHDNRTPALIGILMFVVGVAGDLIVLAVLPPREVVVGLAVAYGVVTMTGALASWPLLLRRVGSLDGWRITRSLIRMLLATAPGLVFALVVMRVTGAVLHQGAAYGLVSLIVGGGGALLLYAACARALGIDEYRFLINSVLGRFRR